MNCMYTDRQVKYSMFCLLPLLPHALGYLLFSPATEYLHLPLGCWLGVSQRESHVGIAFEMSIVVVHGWALYPVDHAPPFLPFLHIILTKIYLTCGGER